MPWKLGFFLQRLSLPAAPHRNEKNRVRGYGVAQRKTRNEKPEIQMSIRNTYLEKQIRTKYVPNGVFREVNTYLVRTSVNTYQIRTKYVLRISIFVAYLRFEMGKIRITYFSLG